MTISRRKPKNFGETPILLPEQVKYSVHFFNVSVPLIKMYGK
jgi:hypothetical protein